MKRRFLRSMLREQDWEHFASDTGYCALRLCRRWNVNLRTLERAFREEFNVSPQRFFDQLRDLRARALAEHGIRKKEIVELLGYKHAAHLSRRLKQKSSDFTLDGAALSSAVSRSVSRRKHE